MKIFGLELTSIMKHPVTLVLLWFIWYNLRHHVEPFIPPEAMTIIDGGLPSAAAIALVAMITKVRSSVESSKADIVQMKTTAVEAADKAVVAAAKAEETATKVQEVADKQDLVADKQHSVAEAQAGIAKAQDAVVRKLGP